jgi:ribosomal-protein-alanine N-acetyltransferase
VVAPNARPDVGGSDEPFSFLNMDRMAADIVAEWRYPGVYAFYDLWSDAEDLAELLDQTRWEGEYFRVDRGGRLTGFWHVKPSSGEAREVGLGLAPELTGQGLGAAFVRAGVDFTVTVTGCPVVSLHVAEFNRRAISVYERVGFRTIGSSVRETPRGALQFLLMELTVSPPE